MISRYNEGMKKCFFLGILCAAFLLPLAINAQEVVMDTTTLQLARVLRVESEELRRVADTEVTALHQTLTVTILRGEEKGKTLTLENDYIELSEGDRFYLLHTTNLLDSTDTYAVSDPYRLPWLFFFIGLFILATVLFGKKQGARGLVALALSVFLIGYILLPGILKGISPFWISLGVASLIIVLGSYITHGWNRTTTAAVWGMIATIFLTGGLAKFAIAVTRLSGFESEEAVYLNFNTGGSLDLVGLLFGGIMIGLLGVLYDAAIGQAVAVHELHHVAPHVPRTAIYKRAIRIGREHIGALVDSLAIAYIGASLPLILLFYSASDASFLTLINQELFATEIIRIIISSIGLILAVPITTFVAVRMLVKLEPGAADPTQLAKEKESLEHVGHVH